MVCFQHWIDDVIFEVEVQVISARNAKCTTRFGCLSNAKGMAWHGDSWDRKRFHSMFIMIIVSFRVLSVLNALHIRAPLNFGR